MIKVTHKGNFNNIETFFNRMKKKNYLNILAKYGQEGVEALAGNTPAQTGKTAESWNFGIDEEEGKTMLYWTNSNENEGISIALLLLHGHGTQDGYYVEGINYVDPVMKPIFDRIAREAWDDVTR